MLKFGSANHRQKKINKAKVHSFPKRESFIIFIHFSSVRERERECVRDWERVREKNEIPWGREHQSSQAGRPEGWGRWGKLSDEATSRWLRSNLWRWKGRATSNDDLDYRSLTTIWTGSDLPRHCSCSKGLRHNGVAVFRFALGL